MGEKKIDKIGFYTIYEITKKDGKKFKVDNGKTIYVPKIHKTLINNNRDVKEFNTLYLAKEYAKKKVKEYNTKKEKKLSKIPKSLYLVLLKEEVTNTLFVKVGITSKRFIMRRFSKNYGYDGYLLETIIRRIDTPHAEEIEKEIKDRLNKNRSISKYRPLLESFSGYSECYNYKNFEDIVKIFDLIVKKY